MSLEEEEKRGWRKELDFGEEEEEEEEGRCPLRLFFVLPLSSTGHTSLVLSFLGRDEGRHLFCTGVFEFSRESRGGSMAASLLFSSKVAGGDGWSLEALDLFGSLRWALRA